MAVERTVIVGGGTARIGERTVRKSEGTVVNVSTGDGTIRTGYSPQVRPGGHLAITLDHCA